MTGIIGSTNATGSNLSISGSSVQYLNPVNIQNFVTGDVVSKVTAYIAVTAGGNGVYEVGLYKKADFGAGSTGAAIAWTKQITIPNATPVGWFDINISNETIDATNGDELGVAISSRVSGTTINFKQSASGTDKSHAVSGAALLSSWTESATSDQQVSLYITTISPNVSVSLTGQAITSATTAPTVSAVANDSVTLTSQLITSNRGTLTVDSNYVGYPVTNATALTTTDSAYQGFILAPADGDRSYWPEIVNSVALVPETSGGNATGRVSSGPQTGVFTLYYYRLFNDTYYDRQVTLVDGTVTNITLVGQQIQSSSGASFVKVDIGIPVPGLSVTASQGTPTITVDNTDTLSSQLISVGQGSVNVTTNTAASIALTGQSITLGQGSVTASGNTSNQLAGFQVTVGQGALTVEADSSEISVNLPGLAITSGTSNVRSVGNVTPDYITYHNLEYVLRTGNV